MPRRSFQFWDTATPGHACYGPGARHFHLLSSPPVRLVHLADLHLGFRQYQRLTPGGINQREADIARTFEAAIDRIIELAPEIILFAGDIFHSVRPSNPAILHAFIHFSRLMQRLPESRVV